MNAKHVQSQSTEEKTPQSLFKKEQNLKSRLFLEQQQAIISMYCYTRKNAITYAAWTLSSPWKTLIRLYALLFHDEFPINITYCKSHWLFSVWHQPGLFWLWIHHLEGKCLKIMQFFATWDFERVTAA